MKTDWTKQKQYDDLTHRHEQEQIEHAGKKDDYPDWNAWYDAEQRMVKRQNEEYAKLIDMLT